jgi:hypothetical protein
LLHAEVHSPRKERSGIAVLVQPQLDREINLQVTSVVGGSQLVERADLDAA